MTRASSWVRAALDRTVLIRSLLTALLVGTILTIIYQGAEIARSGTFPNASWQIALTYLVPFVVAMITSVATIRRTQLGHVRDYELLEEQIAAINKFPDRNPNPVLRVAAHGQLVFANPASAPILAVLRIAVGDAFPEDLLGQLRRNAAESPTRPIDLVADRRTFALVPYYVPELDVLNIYGMDVSGEKVVAKFPDQNPNPVLRMSPDGTLIYGNEASLPVRSALGLDIGSALPKQLVEDLRGVVDGSSRGPVEVRGEGRVFALVPVTIPEFEFVNIYGTDITAEKAIDRFPGQNPNPVLRVARDGTLTYANAASALIVKALGITLGQPLPEPFFEQIQASVAGQRSDTLEVVSEERIFEILVVSVYEFDSINLYGTDVTAARQIEQANRENERLLLNILPVSIAQRLRQGELVIADRFDEMVVLFADVVGFTEMAARLPAAGVVALLNEVFSAFDGLADEFRLEKIKTIGDAYMVVGGLDPGTTDHVARVADMGLRMVDECARLSQESGLDLQIRVGMHMGPAIAGVIGIKKFIYDVWGDTVNTASRMESGGIPGRVQVTAATYEHLRQDFVFEPRGTVAVKGKGLMETYFLVGRQTAAPVGRAQG